MIISTYQIYNVLNELSSQLTRRDKSTSKETEQQDSSSLEAVKISTGGKRLAVIDKVADDIVKRISKYNPVAEGDSEISCLHRHETRKIESNETEFTYNVIDENNMKKIRVLSVENPGFLIDRREN